MLCGCDMSFCYVNWKTLQVEGKHGRYVTLTSVSQTLLFYLSKMWNLDYGISVINITDVASFRIAIFCDYDCAYKL